MNILSARTEIGILATSRVLSQSPNCTESIAAYIPPVNKEFVETRIRFLTEAIISTKKNILFMMSPETALLEQLALFGWDGTAILAIPYDLDEESQERICTNVPSGIHTEYLIEGTYPVAFRPDNGVIICTGIVPSGYRQYITPASCRMTSQYKVFQGERILLSCFPHGTKVPDNGWTYTEPDFFTRIVEEAI